MSEEKIQCPYRTTKYRCEYGKSCVAEIVLNNGRPSQYNECSVAQRQLNGNPWRNERKKVLAELEEHLQNRPEVVALFDDSQKELEEWFKGLVAKVQALRQQLGQLEQLDKDFPNLNSRIYCFGNFFDFKKWETDVIKWRSNFQDFRFKVLLGEEPK
jgi:hypothetical protein